jgi:hypothetical protein
MKRSFQSDSEPKFKRKEPVFKRKEYAYTSEQQESLLMIVCTLEECKEEIRELIDSAPTRNIKEFKLFNAKSKVAEAISMLTGEPFTLAPVDRDPKS